METNKTTIPKRCSFCVYYFEKTRMKGECYQDKDNPKDTKVFNVCPKFKNSRYDNTI